MTITYPVKGIDLSYANKGDYGNPDSLDFVGVKATEIGTDPLWGQHSSWARRNDKILIAYDYGRRTAGGTGVDQAHYLMRVVGTTTRLVALDMEGPDRPTVAQARDWLHTCKAAGYVSGIYASESGFPVGIGQDFSWVANYNRRTHAPSIPWDFWQWQGTPLDRDYYRWSMARLRKLAGLVPPESDAPSRIFLVDIEGTHLHPTILHQTPNGQVVSPPPIYSAHVEASRQKVKGVWWYQITRTSEPKWHGKWFAAQPWMTVEVA